MCHGNVDQRTIEHEVRGRLQAASRSGVRPGRMTARQSLAGWLAHLVARLRRSPRRGVRDA